MQFAKKTASESLECEALYSEVLQFFTASAKLAFAVEIDLAMPMSDWRVIPTPTTKIMMDVRSELMASGSEFAGFIHHNGRYSFYFCMDQFFKAQYLDNMEVIELMATDVSEVNLDQVRIELKKIYGS
jgi:hypothetical protein